MSDRNDDFPKFPKPKTLEEAIEQAEEFSEGLRMASRFDSSKLNTVFGPADGGSWDGAAKRAKVRERMERKKKERAMSNSAPGQPDLPLICSECNKETSIKFPDGRCMECHDASRQKRTNQIIADIRCLSDDPEVQMKRLACRLAVSEANVTEASRRGRMMAQSIIDLNKKLGVQAEVIVDQIAETSGAGGLRDQLSEAEGHLLVLDGVQEILEWEAGQSVLLCAKRLMDELTAG